MNKNKILLLIIVGVLIACYFIFDLNEYLTLEFYNSKRITLDKYILANPVKTGIIYFTFYTIVTALSLPGGPIMTLIGGAIFGLLWATALSSLAAAIGATIAFLGARYLFGDAIRDKYASNLKVINEGIEKDGAFYLFTLRLVPIFPFFIINLLMSMTSIGTITYLLVTYIGRLPLIVVFAYAGTQLAQIKEPADIMSPELIASFILIGIFPLLAKKTVGAINLFKKRELINHKD